MAFSGFFDVAKISKSPTVSFQRRIEPQISARLTNPDCFISSNIS